MDNEIPTPAKGVYIYLDYIALGFVLAAIEELVRGSSWKIWSGCLTLGAVFLFIGVMGPRIVGAIWPKIKTKALSLFAFFRKSKALTAALAENADLKKQILLLMESTEKHSSPITSKLKIHSAFWGTGSATDVSVLEAVNKYPHDGLAIPVSNEALGCDPVFGYGKRLEIEYSYDGSRPVKVSRQEGSRLILPEDLWLKSEIQRLAASSALTKNRKYPGEVFVKQKVVADPPSVDSNITYKDKVRIILTNATGKDIQVWTPLWEAAAIQSQSSPPGARFRLEVGQHEWKRGNWVKDNNGKDQEWSSLELEARLSTECWIGLRPPVGGQSIAECVRTSTLLGTAIFPVKIDGKLYEVSIKL